MKEPYQVERDEFIRQLEENWDSEKKRIMPGGPRTRDERAVAAAIDCKRVDDVNAFFAVSARETSYSLGPSIDSLEGEELALALAGLTSEGMVVHIDRDHRISRQPQKRMPRDLRQAWLAFHPRWVAAQVAHVVAEAIQRLKATKSELIGERRRKRKNVYRNGRRGKANKPGPKPRRKLNLSSKSGLRKRAA